MSDKLVSPAPSPDAVHGRFEPDRRSFLRTVATYSVAGMAMPMGLSACGGGGSSGRDEPDFVRMSATQAVASMRNGDFSAESYANALTQRVQQLSSLNAFISFDASKVLEAAREADLRRRRGEALGALHGLVLPIKDSVNTKDYPTTSGTNGLRNFRPANDAPIVQTLKNAGAIVLGKTNLHELSLGITSNNYAFGAVHNPFDTTRVPGGSSGGTAVAVATGMAAAGLAEDTAGSIRVPAALCGIVGFRPTTGRYVSTGVAPLTARFDQVGPHARSVSDIILMDQVMAGRTTQIPPTSLVGVRIGVPRGYYYDAIDTDVTRVMASTLDKLRAAGAVLVEADVPDVEALSAASNSPVVLYEMRDALADYLSTYGAPVDFDALMLASSADILAVYNAFLVAGAPYAISSSLHSDAVNTYLPALKAAFANYFTSNNLAAIVFPTTKTSAPLIGQDDTITVDGASVSLRTFLGDNIAPGSCAGIPGLVLPAGLSSGGLPIGVEFNAPVGQDEALLSLGLSLQTALGSLSRNALG